MAPSAILWLIDCTPSAIENVLLPLPQFLKDLLYFAILGKLILSWVPSWWICTSTRLSQAEKIHQKDGKIHNLDRGEGFPSHMARVQSCDWLLDLWCKGESPSSSSSIFLRFSRFYYIGGFHFELGSPTETWCICTSTPLLRQRSWPKGRGTQARQTSLSW